VAAKVLGGGLSDAVDKETPKTSIGLLSALEAKVGHEGHADDARVQSLVVCDQVRRCADPRVPRATVEVLGEVGPDDTRARLALLNQQRGESPVWPANVYGT
jgi:hypothetical protein